MMIVFQSSAVVISLAFVGARKKRKKKENKEMGMKKILMQESVANLHPGATWKRPSEGMNA